MHVEIRLQPDMWYFMSSAMANHYHPVQCCDPVRLSHRLFPCLSVINCPDHVQPWPGYAPSTPPSSPVIETKKALVRKARSGKIGQDYVRNMKQIFSPCSPCPRDITQKARDDRSEAQGWGGSAQETQPLLITGHHPYLRFKRRGHRPGRGHGFGCSAQGCWAGRRQRRRRSWRASGSSRRCLRGRTGCPHRPTGPAAGPPEQTRAR